MKKETKSGPPIGTKSADGSPSFKKSFPGPTAKKSPAVEALAMTDQQISETRNNEAVHAIIDKAAKELGDLGLKYFIGAVDKQPTASDGGKVYTHNDMTGEDFTYMLDIALPTKEDAVRLGIWVGQLIQIRTKKDGPQKGN